MQIQPTVVRCDKWNLVFFAFLGFGISALVYFADPHRSLKTMEIGFGPLSFTMLESTAKVIRFSAFLWMISIVPMMLLVGLQRVVFRTDSLTYATMFGQQKIQYYEIREIELVKAWRQGAPVFFLYLTADRDARYQIPFAAFSKPDCVRILEIVLRCSCQAQTNDFAHQFIKQHAPR